ncbi:helix-turn-helix transcriptional regulator [Mucilaginibacter robiniae]|uniref:Helix-turn-helix transcriptional regulator n=1 Tax=Mucilaginibacter robiniae TaxID=2728022 RepID=A0A7L5DTJ9_9SPHI|nr:helix-turn-helix transcriptional regulator [Mucilaginibacter robiniae]QJD94420.1 helix-turn-helix transcriptional regulator [Mucilaginibacter robiniae]
MNKHYGQIVERIIRRNGYSISELARLMNVNRRSVYNWFNQKRLKSDIIYRISTVLNYDFSVEFPELFTSEDFHKNNNEVKSQKNDVESSEDQSSQIKWKDKYITLLERYNELLANNLNVNSRKL